ncbi:hypothetical protein AB1A81_02370 [Bdellovibrio bacteriovorus]|uniref:Uncharacterized protein n=1 Tax=Bdellovibrio bacteriovorus (strain ATCC 15356 / DSM 50701 / NCIMB 9529 / HD100) TaxID=264462 RepID=Q6MQF6_BDEBA|nr:hypothetical protein [Bdellovibrio bacteriovorus]CAE78491.1 hypothetical protein predicted by Glimmer/Critica [Bdellovibrio bacteriovorus HD100]
MYHEITGKTQEITKIHNAPIQISIKDIQTLHFKIQQSFDQYHVRLENSSFKLFFVDDNQVTFDSLDKLIEQGRASDSSLESLLITYNFGIILPKHNKLQTYNLSIRLISRVGSHNKLKSQDFPFPAKYLMFAGSTAIFSIKYIDYSVAKYIQNVFDGWFDSTKKARSSKTYKFISSKSENAPLITRVLLSTMAVLFTVAAVPSALSTTSTPVDLAKFLIVAFSFIALFGIGGLVLGRSIENSIDDWAELSFVEITEKDKRMIEEAQDYYRNSKIKLLLGIISTILLSLVGNYIWSILVPLIK